MTVLVARSPGQLGNQLFLFAHVLAFAIEAGVAVANPAFGAYGRWFPAFGGDPLCRVPAPARRFPARLARRRARRGVGAIAGRVVPRVARLPAVDGIVVPDGVACDLDAPEALERARRARVLVVDGWELRAPAALSRHRAAVLDVLTPHARARAVAAAAVRRARRGGPVVGLHVRRGDYAEFRGGAFRYDLAAYRAVAERALAAYGPDSALLVCSDGPLPGAFFDGLRAFPGPGDVLEDLCALAACDALIGPPSTFSMWASFSGAVPLQMLDRPDAEIDPPRAAPIVG